MMLITAGMSVCSKMCDSECNKCMFVKYKPIKAFMMNLFKHAYKN